MVVKSSGKMHKTRKKLKLKENATVNKFMEKFEIGDRVWIKICPSVHNFPHPKFNGRTGKIVGKRGNAYMIEVSDLNSKKKIIASAVHLKRHG